MSRASLRASDPHRTEQHRDPAADQPGYAQALDELDAILRELEGADVDVDRLADRVARATALLAICRERIGTARLRIDEVIADLDGAADARVSRPLKHLRQRVPSKCPKVVTADRTSGPNALCQPTSDIRVPSRLRRADDVHVRGPSPVRRHRRVEGFGRRADA